MVINTDIPYTEKQARGGGGEGVCVQGGNLQFKIGRAHV